MEFDSLYETMEDSFENLQVACCTEAGADLGVGHSAATTKWFSIIRKKGVIHYIAFELTGGGRFVG